MVETSLRTSKTQGKATARVETRPIRTYTWDRASRYPILFGGGYRFVYPYTMEDRLLHKAVEKPYKHLILENEYIQVIILPELGGHLWRAYDKVSGKEIFYNNQVVKPGLIGLRGAWCATGVEWNFPIGHSVATVSTVDYDYFENPDGSVTGVIGDVDRTTRMKWTVKVTVFPGQLGFRLDTVLSNPTTYPHRYMYWENAAIHATDGFQFIAPAKKAWTWGGKTDFPVADGVDKSWYIAHPRSIDYFALGLGQDYFGFYDHSRRFGAVHVADYHLMPGKKFFTWGMAEHARQWARNLTDDDGPYIELQCGLTPTQAAFNFLTPQTSLRWDETWFSIGDLGYFVYANRDAALHLSDRLDKPPYPEEVEVAVVANRDHANAMLVVTAVGKTLLSRSGVDLKAGIPERGSVKLPAGATAVEVNVAAGGETILDYSTTEWANIRELPYDNPRELHRVREGSPKILVEAAIAQMKWFNLRKSMTLIDTALEKKPNHTDARYWKGNLLFNMYRYDDAAEYLRKVSARNANHAIALFLLAEIGRFRGDYREALKLARRLGRREDSRLMARALEGRVLLMTGKYAKAAEALGEASASSDAAPGTMSLYAAALRKAGRKGEAESVARRVLEIDPLEYMAHNELALAGRPSSRDEVMHGEVESYIELAAQYEDASLFDEAAEVLEWCRASIPAGAANPILLYHLAYANERLGRETEAAALYAAASSADPDYALPLRREDVVAVEAAIRRNEGDSLAHYILGLYMAWKTHDEEAVAHWKTALAAMSEYPVLLRNLGRYYLLQAENPAEAADYYSRAIHAAPRDEELYAEADDAYAKLGDIDARIALLEKGFAALPTSQKVRKLLAQSYYFAGRNDEAIDVLMSAELDHWEGDRMGHHIYVQAYIDKGKRMLEDKRFADAAHCFEKAREYPANLKVGKPAYPGHAPQLYLLAMAHEGLGQKDRAKAALEQGANEVHEGWIGRGSEEEYYKGLCLAGLGRRRAARSIWRAMTKSQTWHWSMTEAYDNFIKGLGWQGLEDWDKAEEQFEKALSYDRSNRKVQYHLERTREHRQAGA